MLNKRKKKIVPIEEAPDWLVDNIHLRKGYRIHDSFSSALKSIFELHNELWNIWTHLIGAVLVLALLIYLIMNRTYSIEIYKDVHDKFHKLEFSNILKNQYVDKILPFIEKIKNSSLDDFNLHLDVVDFMNEPINLYKNKIKEIKTSLIEKKEHLIKDMDLFLEEVEHYQENLVKKLEILKDTSLHQIHEIYEHIDEWYEEHKKKITENFMPKFQHFKEFLPMIIYLISVFTCLGLSAIFHTFFPISLKVYKLLQRLDMAGISILIFGSSYATQSYMFKCTPSYFWVYSSFSFISCFSVFFISMFEFFHEPKFNHIKGMMFGVLGIGNGVSILHPLIFSSFETRTEFIFDSWFFLGGLVMGASYLIGMAIYVQKLPERLYPGYFDIWLNSHTIFHLFVCLASTIFYFALDHLYSLSKDVVCN